MMLAHHCSPTRRRLRQVLEPFIAEAAALPGVDRYRKRFTTDVHLWTLVLHGLSGMTSLRQTHAQLAAQPELWSQWGLPRWVSLSQLARSSSSRPIAPFELLAHRLMAATSSGHQSASSRSLQALDSTFLPLSHARSPWARYGQSAAGLRLHVLLGLPCADPDDELILDLCLTGTETNDHDALATWDLSRLAGRTLLMDLGYYGHQQLARLQQAGVDVITPAHPQASTTVLAELPLPASRWISPRLWLLADQHVQVGSPNNRRGATLSHLRQVTVQTPDGSIQSLLTTRFDLAAAEVVRAYRRRWRIELLFRWIKHHLGMLPPIGTSPQAVWITVLLAIIVQALYALLHHHKPVNVSRVAWMRQLAICLQREFPIPGG
jgi:putative transposase